MIGEITVQNIKFWAVIEQQQEVIKEVHNAHSCKRIVTYLEELLTEGEEESAVWAAAVTAVKEECLLLVHDDTKTPYCKIVVPDIMQSAASAAATAAARTGADALEPTWSTSSSSSSLPIWALIPMSHGLPAQGRFGCIKRTVLKAGKLLVATAALAALLAPTSAAAAFAIKTCSNNPERCKRRSAPPVQPFSRQPTQQR